MREPISSVMISLASIRSRSALDLAIDLGTANLRIIERGSGLIFNEPSLCLYDVKNGRKRFIEAGQAVLSMIGRLPTQSVICKPLSRGVLQDIDATVDLLRYSLTKAVGKLGRRRPAAMIGIPADATKAEANALIAAASDAGLGRVELVREPFAAAIGAELPIQEIGASMVIECGAGTTEIAVFSADGQCKSRSVRLGSETLNQALIDHLAAKRHFAIGGSTAEELKRWLLGSDWSTLGEGAATHVKGKSLETGLPRTLALPSSEFDPVIERHFAPFAEAARMVLADLSPDLAADLLDGNVVATGGGVSTRFLAGAIKRECGLVVRFADAPLGCVANGLNALLDRRAA